MRMRIEDRIKRWREEEPGAETEGHIELICEAEVELRRLRNLAEKRAWLLASPERRSRMRGQRRTR